MVVQQKKGSADVSTKHFWIKGKNAKLKRIPFAHENTTKDYLPVYVILGVADY